MTNDDVMQLPLLVFSRLPGKIDTAESVANELGPYTSKKISVCPSAVFLSMKDISKVVKVDGGTLVGLAMPNERVGRRY